MALRKLFFYGIAIVLFPLIGLILSFAFMMLWNLGFISIFPFLPKISLFISFLIITLLTIIRLKVGDRLKG